jgi:hypothetical protein
MVALLASLPGLLGVVLLGLYFWQFWGSLSPAQDVWGQFGDFIGGILNPFIAWMTLVAIAISLRYTVHALRESAKATQISQSQLDHEREEREQRRIEEQNTRRAEHTFRIYEIWMSPEMQEKRREALHLLRSLPQDEGFPLLGMAGRQGFREDARSRLIYYKIKDI